MSHQRMPRRNLADILAAAERAGSAFRAKASRARKRFSRRHRLKVTLNNAFGDMAVNSLNLKTLQSHEDLDQDSAGHEQTAEAIARLEARLAAQSSPHRGGDVLALRERGAMDGMSRLDSFLSASISMAFIHRASSETDYKEQQPYQMFAANSYRFVFREYCLDAVAQPSQILFFTMVSLLYLLLTGLEFDDERLGNIALPLGCLFSYELVVRFFGSKAAPWRRPYLIFDTLVLLSIVGLSVRDIVGQAQQTGGFVRRHRDPINAYLVAVHSTRILVHYGDIYRHSMTWWNRAAFLLVKVAKRAFVLSCSTLLIVVTTCGIFADFLRSGYEHEFAGDVDADDREGLQDMEGNATIHVVINDYFPNLKMSVVTLFEVGFGNMKWGTLILEPFMEASSGLTILFCFYVVIMSLIFSNLIIGTFIKEFRDSQLAEDADRRLNLNSSKLKWILDELDMINGEVRDRISVGLFCATVHHSNLPYLLKTSVRMLKVIANAIVPNEAGEVMIADLLTAVYKSNLFSLTPVTDSYAAFVTDLRMRDLQASARILHDLVDNLEIKLADVDVKRRESKAVREEHWAECENTARLWDVQLADLERTYEDLHEAVLVCLQNSKTSTGELRIHMKAVTEALRAHVDGTLASYNENHQVLEENEFEVIIDDKSQNDVGVRWHRTEDNIMVLSVEGGAIAEWNEVHVRKRVSEGYILRAVNGVEQDLDFMERTLKMSNAKTLRFKKSRELLITVHKSPADSYGLEVAKMERHGGLLLVTNVREGLVRDFCQKHPLLPQLKAGDFIAAVNNCRGHTRQMLSMLRAGGKVRIVALVT